jgi:flagellar biosynthesis GTPase FlhF
MDASTSNGSDDDVKTFRGRSLEELLPQIRAELGPDAIVLRRREGLGGGVGGFFQRPYVEVDARAAHADERPLEIRSDRATVEGLSSPAVQALFEQATPFADALAAAARESRMEEDVFSATFTPDPAAEPRYEPHPELDAGRVGADSAGLYGPQPNTAAIEDAAPEPRVREEPRARRARPVTPEPPLDVEPEEAVEEFEPAAPGAPSRPPSADAAEERLVAAGLSRALAADIVGEAVAHALPFSNPRNLKKLVRTALARRIPVPAGFGPGPRTIAVVGGGGAGKSSTVAHLAAAYHGAGADVAVISLRGDGSLAARLQPLGIAVIVADDAAQATERLGARSALLTLIDTPALGPSHAPAAVKALGADLKALGAEVHLALPATLSSAAAAEVAAALAVLAPTHVALTHADETQRPGAPLELALAASRPLSYVCTREQALPADPAALAQQLLP